LNIDKKDLNLSRDFENKIKSKRITIYGAYYPKEELDRLKNLRKYLKKQKFKRVNLVMNYPRNFFKIPYIENGDEFIYEKSIYCVENSDLNIFIYTYDGKLEGESIELNYAIDHAKDFLIFIETGENLPACSRVITGLLKKIGIRYIPFPRDDDKYLQEAVYNRIFEYFL
jgi:hypothetical protein